MAVKVDRVAEIGKPIHIYNDAPVDVTSTNPNSPDEIIPKQNVGLLDSGAVTAQIFESNGQELRAFIEVSIKEPASDDDWERIPYSPTQDYWVIPANGHDLIYLDSGILFKFLRISGYVTSGTAKGEGHVLLQ